MTTRYALDPAMPVLTRPDGAVQVGWDPRRAVLVRPPAGMTTTGLAALLRSMQVPAERCALGRRAAQHGLPDAAAFNDLLSALLGAGVAVESTAPSARPAARAPSVRVHGRGPLSELLTDALRCSGARIRCSSQPHAAIATAGTDLVVLADYLVAEPRMVRELHAARIAHLPVRVRDGTGLIGPLVIPGVTSCLDCADLHRRDRDAAWPAVAAQLRDTVAQADRATLLGTAALALHHITRVIAAVRGSASERDRPPPSLNATLEFDVAAGSIMTRHWQRHPLCCC